MQSGDSDLILSFPNSKCGHMCYLCGQILSHHECLSNYILACTPEIFVSRVSPDVVPYPIATIIFFTSRVACNITKVVSDYDGTLC